MPSYSPQLAAHKSWLGLVQPVGLVVSPPALVKAQAVLGRNVVDLQQTLLAIVRRPPGDADPYLDDFPTFADRLLGWAPEDLVAPSDDLEVALPDYGDTLRPTHAVIDGMAGGEILVLDQVEPTGTNLDQPPAKEK